MDLRILDAGDAAFTIEFGDIIDPRLLAAVNALDAAMASRQAAGGLAGVIETVPTFCSLTVLFDPLITSRAELLAELQPLFAATEQTALPERLRLPRRSNPCVRVPPGSVAIANGLTAIYPWESPGGWRLLGRCSVPLFDARRASPSLLAAGDRVQFEPVAIGEYQSLAIGLATGEIDPQRWLIAHTANIAGL